MAKIDVMDRAINRGQTVWWVAPTYSNLASHWRETKKMITGAPFLGIKNEKDRFMQFKSGGIIEFKSADRHDNLRGSGLDFVVLDEAAYMSEVVWADIISPMLMDRRGQAMIISTPKGRANWFYDVYQLGMNRDKNPDWVSFQYSSADNPYIDAAYIETQRHLMTKSRYEQEILAVFSDVEGGTFVGLEKITTATPLPGPEPDGIYHMGIDWGRKNDYTVISVFDIIARKQVHLEQFSDIGYDAQSRRVGRAIELWQPDRVWVEENNIGHVMLERLRGEFHSGIRGVYMTHSTKTALVERFAGNVEVGYLTIFNPSVSRIARIQYEQLSSFERKKTRSGLDVTYSAPEGRHDDIVIADLLAASHIRRKMANWSAFGSVPNVFY